VLLLVADMSVLPLGSPSLKKKCFSCAGNLYKVKFIVWQDFISLVIKYYQLITFVNSCQSLSHKDHADLHNVVVRPGKMWVQLQQIKHQARRVVVCKKDRTGTTSYMEPTTLIKYSSSSPTIRFSRALEKSSLLPFLLKQQSGHKIPQIDLHAPQLKSPLSRSCVSRCSFARIWSSIGGGAQEEAGRMGEGSRELGCGGEGSRGEQGRRRGPLPRARLGAHPCRPCSARCCRIS
jgi:hypothetical protein